MAKFTKIILCLLIFLISFQAQAKNPPPGTGTSDLPANIFLLLDHSKSMDAAISTAGEVDLVWDVATDSSENVYMLEYYMNRISVFDSSGDFVKRIGGYGTGCSQWQLSHSFAIYNDRIYIADFYGNRIVVLDLNGGCIATQLTYYTLPLAIAVGSTGTFVSHYVGGTIGTVISTYTTGSLSFNSAWDMGSGNVNLTFGMNLNSAGNKLIIADDRNNTLVEYSLSGTNIIAQRNQTSTSSNWGTSNTKFKKPWDAAYDSSDNIYVTDRRNQRVKKYNSSFAYQAKNRNATTINTSGPFNHATGIHIDSSDNIFIADWQNHYVRKFDTNLTLQDSIGGGRGSRLDVAKKVIKKIVTDTELTSGANFGLIEWSSDNNSKTKVKVPISSSGAAAIYASVDGIAAAGGTALRYAMQKARTQWTSGKIPHWKESCAKNYVIVITDGAYSDNPIPTITNMNDNLGIKTYIIGFTVGAHTKYSNVATAGGTNPPGPLFATNEAELLAKLTDAIKQAISGSLTFTTPAVMSDVTKGGFVYQSTFEYEKSKQWKGSLTKYQLNKDDGTFGAEVWDASEKLNDRSASDRSIWTSGIGTIDLDNFTTSNRDDLRIHMYPNAAPADDDIDKLINFVRGVDSYDEDEDSSTTDERHKLGDIYHSDLIIVGPVESSTEDDQTSNFKKKDAYYRSKNKYSEFIESTRCGVVCKNRKEIVLAGANDGMLHAFDSGTKNAADGGKELWAYIPYNILAKLPTMVSEKANSTNSIYGVDGSPVVKDIYYDDTPNDGKDNPVWKTIVLSGLGAGGKGYFALDITNPDSPKHLFTIYNDTLVQAVIHLDKDENKREYGYAGGGIPAEFDYRKLGETWSTPRIIRIKVDGKDKWVAVFGGGYNGTTSYDFGSAVFVMDLENEGKLLKKIDIADWDYGTVSGSDTADGVRTDFYLPWNYNTNKFYIKVQINNSTPTSHSLTGTYDEDTSMMTGAKIQFATAPAWGSVIQLHKIPASNIVNAVPSDLTVVTAAGTEKANYSGAMVYATDLEGKITKINLTDQGTLYESAIIFDAESNNDNGRFVFKRAQATILDNKLWLYFGTGNTQKLGEQNSKIKNRVYGIKDKDFPDFVKRNTINPGKISECTTPPTCPGDDKLGWYVNLKNSQKVTAESTLDKDWVYFPLYEPNPGDVCSTGTAWFKAHYNKCGNQTLSIKLGKGVLSKAVVEGDNIYIALSGEAEEKFEKTGNLIQLKSQAEGGVGKVQLQGWREN